MSISVKGASPIGEKPINPLYPDMGFKRNEACLDMHGHIGNTVES